MVPQTTTKSTKMLKPEAKLKKELGLPDNAGPDQIADACYGKRDNPQIRKLLEEANENAKKDAQRFQDKDPGHLNRIGQYDNLIKLHTPSTFEGIEIGPKKTASDRKKRMKQHQQQQ